MNNTYQKALYIFIIGMSGGLILGLPLILGGYYLHLFTMIFFFAFLGSAWNILGGYAGQFSFGHAAFFGTGVYTSTLLQIHAGVNPWIGMGLAGIAGMGLGLFIGFLSFRYGLRGPYFALAMLALAEMLKLIAIEWMSSRYPLGITIPLRGDSLLYFQFRDKAPYYYISFLMMAGALYLTHFIGVRKIGSYFKAIRENESAAEALGINVFRYKLIAMAISGFLTAMGGTFYSQYYLNIEEEAAFGAGISIEILMGPIIGGAGTVFGPLLGAAILECLSETSRNFLGGYSGVHLMIYGAALVFVIIFLPHGIMGGIQGTFSKITKSRQKA